MVWDEENRLRGINDNGRLHLYTYDHTGERALKSSAESSLAVINGLASAVITHTEDYTAYVSPYFVVQKGKFTKHYFEGATRVVSKLGEGTFSHKNTGIMAGGLDYLKRTQKEQEARDRYIKGLNVPPGPPTQHGIYATPEWTKESYPSIDWEAINQNQEPPEGWPRYPRFNEPGDVPGPPVQFGPPVTNANVKAGHGFIPNGVEEKNLYYYHPDHLGSSSYITDKNGEVIQHTEYMAFGETFVDEHSVNPTQPYLFNGKELDYETGLYYYGARYYDPKISIFLNVDPLVEKTISPYAYVNNNPINLIDPTGMEAENPPVKEIQEIILIGRKKTRNFFQKLWGGFTKSVQWVGKQFRKYERDDININNIGVDVGVGGKNVKLGPLARVSAQGSLGSISWDNKNDDINIKGPQLSLGLYIGNKRDVGFEVDVQSIEIGVISQRLKVIDISLTGNLLGLGLGDNKLHGVHLAEISVFDSESKRGYWFNGKLGTHTEPNRLIDVNNDGQLSPMTIIGGTLKYGISADIEWNADQTASRFLGGTGLGSGWKNNK